jgi:hypothetical protein
MEASANISFLLKEINKIIFNVFTRIFQCTPISPDRSKAIPVTGHGGP